MRRLRIEFRLVEAEAAAAADSKKEKSANAKAKDEKDETKDGVKGKGQKSKIWKNVKKIFALKGRRSEQKYVLQEFSNKAPLGEIARTYPLSNFFPHEGTVCAKCGADAPPFPQNIRNWQITTTEGYHHIPPLYVRYGKVFRAARVMTQVRFLTD